MIRRHGVKAFGLAREYWCVLGDYVSLLTLYVVIIGLLPFIVLVLLAQEGAMTEEDH